MAGLVHTPAFLPPVLPNELARLTGVAGLRSEERFHGRAGVSGDLRKSSQCVIGWRPTDSRAPSTPSPAESFTPRVPACLRERAQWVCWRYIDRGGKQTKCPISPTKGGNASSTDPATWSTFEQALKAWRASSKLAGVGFVFSNDDPFAGIDLDDCLDAATGEVKPWARPILAQLDSYSEISPSGKGVKVFVRAAKTGPRCKTGYEDGAVEMYDRGRFFTVTGRPVAGSASDVAERQPAFDAVYQLVFDKPAAPRLPAPRPSNNGQVHLDDDEILRLACASRKSGAKFAALWAGRWNEHFNSRSEADSSVVFTLASVRPTGDGQLRELRGRHGRDPRGCWRPRLPGQCRRAAAAGGQ